MYKIKNTSSEYLLDNGFKELNNGSFRLRFPISFYKRTPTIFCNAIVYPENGKRVTIEVEKTNGMPYGMWYDTECNQLSKRFRKELEDNIHRRMNKVGARHYENR